MTHYYCDTCNKYWSFPVEKCIFCHGGLREIDENNYRVIGSTQVCIPSKGNEKVPYFEYLLESSCGNKILIKSFQILQINDKFDLAEKRTEGTIVGVIGTGQLGLGIAEYLLRSDYPVMIKTRHKGNNDPVSSKITKKLSKDHTREQIESRLKNLKIVTDYRELSGCDIIIEAVTEDIEIKKEIFSVLSGLCDEKTILATNTSSLSIDDLAAVTGRPDKCIGMHFFNPVSKMDLIEVVLGSKTSDNTRNAIIQFSLKINKKPIVVKNSPGFIVNRLLLPQVNDAIKLYENGIASKNDIDAAMKMGLNHPMGPFALADLIGLDICLMILETLFESLKEERFRPAKTLVDLVAAGKLGLKSGEGFYKYK